MHSTIRRIAPILVLVLAILAAVWFVSQDDNNAANEPLSASGIIEATQVNISPTIGGRIEAVLVSAGEAVEAGQALIQLDASGLEIQRRQAEAGVAAAEAALQAAQAALQSAQAAQESAQAGYEAALANRDLIAAGALEEQRQAAQAQLDLAQANLAALNATLHTLTAGVRPEEISAARARLEQAWQAYTALKVLLSDDQMEQARALRDQAEENLSRAQARANQLMSEAGLPPSALEAAQRWLEECQQAREQADALLAAAQDPQTPYALQIEAARRSWDSAARYLAQAQARLDYLETLDDLPQAGRDAAQEAVDDAQKLRDAAREAYQALANGDQRLRLDQAWNEVLAAQRALNGLARFANPGVSPSLETLLYQIDAAQASKEAAAANLALLERGARPEQLAAAEAQVQAAQAQREAMAAQAQAAAAQAAIASAQRESAQATLEQVEYQITQLTLTSPFQGVVLQRAAEVGEIASPGATLLVIGNLQDLTITVYLPEDRYGRLRIGQEAEVRVDSYPGETFVGRVTYIADRAEFTPRNVQTAEGRRTTVFAVQIAIANPQGKLKPGMPADVVFEP